MERASAMTNVWYLYKYCIGNEFQIFNSMMLDIGFLCCWNFVCLNLNILIFDSSVAEKENGFFFLAVALVKIFTLHNEL